MMADSGDHVEDHVEAFDRQESQATKQDKPQQASGGNPIYNDEAHLDPSRWWFASSAFPLIAGTLGPVANAFSICALVRPWRQKFPPGSDLDKAQFVPDPIWCVVLPSLSSLVGRMLISLSRLTVINAIQVVMAVIANLVLLLNMARKIRFSVAQPITIVTW